ncbi:MAG: hypothetical protein A2Y33_13305 [Spirochaetes bacterium GWF1_51_8]|nr:MAG: hypothetical protein A2Y33_13305 [Spirochaetes bacterium GWF1_51_8]
MKVFFLLLLVLISGNTVYAEQKAQSFKEMLGLAKNESSPDKKIEYLQSAAKLAKTAGDKQWVHYQIGITYGEGLGDFYRGFIEVSTAYQLGFTNKAVSAYINKYTHDPEVRFIDGDSPPLPGNPKIPAGQFSFILISDTHVLTVLPDSNYIQLKNKLIESDRFIIINGDLVSSPKDPGNYFRAKELFDSIGLPYYTSIGNHDSHYGGWFEYKHSFGKSHYSFQAGDLLVICLDSANGKLGKSQMEWLRDVLKSKNPGPCVVFSHFPLIGQPNYIFTNQTDFPEAVKLFEKYEVDWVFAGHTHAHSYVQTNGINYLTSPVFYSQYGKYIRMTYDNGKLEYKLLPLYP